MSRVLPILFNTEMVRAILDGRKTVTRRVVKPQPTNDIQCPLGYCTDGNKSEIGKFAFGSHEGGGKMIFCKPPYQTDDILYVRESIWQKVGHYLDVDGETKPSWCKEFRYAATDEKPETGWNYSWAKRPSIHMPKEAARIWMRVTDVRVERLREISPEECICEGIEPEALKDVGGEFVRGMFEDLWDSTIKKSDLDRYGWQANPYVYKISFIRIDKKEVDENA